MPGTYHREQLQAVPEMETEYLPNSTQKGLAAKLEKEKIIPPFRTRGGPQGNSWAEKTVAGLSDKETGGEQRDILMWRLVAYLRQGNSKQQALRRLKDSVAEKVANPAKLAVLQKPDR